MGDRAEVSHQTRTSDDHSLRLGCWADGARLADTLRASGLDRCAYSGGPAPEMRGRLFVPLAGPWLLGRGCAGRRRCGEPGGWCEDAHSWSRPTARAGALRASGDMLSRPGAFDAVGDRIPVPERADCPRLERTAPSRAECPPPASETQSPQDAVEARDPRQSRRPPARNCQESGLMTWDASGPHPRKSLKSDKPDLSLVHLTGVQGSGILCGNRSTSYGRRRIPDCSGRPSVAVHQSNRQGRSRAPSSGQVRDDVPRGDQGAPGR